MNSVESILSTGEWRHVPGCMRYVVSKDGILIDTKKMRIVPQSINGSGYSMCTLERDDGTRRTYGIHRLLALAYIEDSRDVSGLVVNHRNGIKLDNRIENLEWVTYRENAEHAGANGLTSRCIPISVRDVNTGVVTKYPSVLMAAEDLGISKDMVSYYLGFGERRVSPGLKQYRKGHGDESWYVPVDVMRELLANGSANQVLCRWIRPDGYEIKCFATQADLAAYLNVSVVTISLWLDRPNQPVLPGYIQVKLLSDETPWRDVENPDQELYPYRVVVTHEKTGEVLTFDSAKECADRMGLKPTALNYRLKCGDRKAFSDGYRYKYAFQQPMVHPSSNGRVETSLIAGTR